jgi:hypothetical protein
MRNAHCDDGQPAEQVKAANQPAEAKTGEHRYASCLGGVAERLKAPVLKTGKGLRPS